MSKKKGRDIFTHWAQNDVSEFFGFVMECMHNSISRPIEVNITGTSENSTDKMAILCYNEVKNIYEKEYSEVMDIFYGIHSLSDFAKNGMSTIKPRGRYSC